MSTEFSIDGINCFMNRQEAEEHLPEILHINKEIHKRLSDTGFDHLDFCDVSADGIQVRLYHKDIYGFSFGAQQTINHDWSNIEDVIEDSIKDFKSNDTPEHIKSMKDFIADGLKYGWD